MKKLSLLTKHAVEKVLKKYPDWTASANNKILKISIIFPSHVEALVFIARVTVHAEVQQHHPEILYSYQKVTVKLTTHEAKGLTVRDVKLLEKIDQLKPTTRV